MNRYKVGDKVLYRGLVRTITEVMKARFFEDGYLYELDRSEVPLIESIGDYVAFGKELSPYIEGNKNMKHILDKYDS